MSAGELLPHLFRSEYRKIVSVLCRHFGLHDIQIAEDITSDTFLSAAETWPINGVPENPTAWLYHVASNKAVNALKRRQVFDQKVKTRVSTTTSTTPSEIDLTPQNINDSQLLMMFAICHPSIPVESQVGLALRILCGFGIDEIAAAFLTNKETINKRLFRAKEKLREENIGLGTPAAHELDVRLDGVLTTLYLLFNEGYYSQRQDQVLKKELCLEAIRLCMMLLENSQTNKPAVNALMSLMCLQASRLDARIDDQGEQILYDDQDASLWDADLIRRGIYYMSCAARGNDYTHFHLEAAIAYWSTVKEDSKEKWEAILQLYNQLLQIQYSPVAALNRTYALARANGKEEGIREAEKLRLTDNHFYFTLLGELYSGLDPGKARVNFEKAVSLARTEHERKTLRKKIAKL